MKGGPVEAAGGIPQVEVADQALLLALRADVEPGLTGVLAGLIKSGLIDPPDLWARAGRHQVLPTVARIFTTPELQPVLGEQMAAAAWDYRRQVLAVNLARHAELKGIVERMQAVGIPAVPLKGTYLAERYYRGLDGRLSGDIDVLVPAGLLPRARAVLHELGFRPAPEVSPARNLHPFHDPAFIRRGVGGWSVVELHWGLTDPKFVTVDYGLLWGRITDRLSSDPDWPATLPPEEELLFLAVHLPKHDAGVLRLLTDLDRVVRRHATSLDWDGLTSLARRWGAGPMLYFGLERARVLLGTPVPEDPLQVLRPAAWRRLAVFWLAGPGAIFNLTDPENVRANRFKLAYCAMLTPARRFFKGCWANFFAPEPADSPLRPGGRLTRMARGVGRLVLAVTSGGPPRRPRGRISTFAQPLVNRLTTGPR